MQFYPEGFGVPLPPVHWCGGDCRVAYPLVRRVGALNAPDRLVVGF
jgi:hypothetical protein